MLFYFLFCYFPHLDLTSRYTAATSSLSAELDSTLQSLFALHWALASVEKCLVIIGCSVDHKPFCVCTAVGHWLKGWAFSRHCQILWLSKALQFHSLRFFLSPIIVALVGSLGILSHRPTFTQSLDTLVFDFVLCHNQRKCNSQMFCCRLQVSPTYLYVRALHLIHAVVTLKYVAHDSWLLPKVHGELRAELTLWPTHWDMLEDDSFCSFPAGPWL